MRFRAYRVPAADVVPRRAEAWVAPSAGAGWRVDRGSSTGIVSRLLVTDQRAVSRRAAVGGHRAVLVARLPKHLIAAPESQVHACGARRLDVGALVTRPVLVMAHREKDLAIEQLGPLRTPVGVDAGHVAHVVAVCLQPVNGGYFLPENEVLGAGVSADAVARGDRPVIAHLVGSPIAARGGAAAVQAVPAPTIVGVPGRVRRLEDNIMERLIVADNEGDVVLAACRVLTHQMRKVNARDCSGRHRPGGRHDPVARID